MNQRRRKALKKIILGVILLAVGGALYLYDNRTQKIADFPGCVKAGYPVMESYPRQCRTPDGQSFREDIGNELEKDNLIRIAAPRPNAQVSSPLAVKGMARGNWFFEASFPIRLFDGNGEIIARGIAQADGDWMTEEFVQFTAVLEFKNPTTTAGTLLLDKDNPSGLPENEDALRMPVRFR